jgi:hypothetical protein
MYQNVFEEREALAPLDQLVQTPVRQVCQALQHISKMCKVRKKNFFCLGSFIEIT